VKRTTVAIDSDLLRRLKREAAESGRSLQSVINEKLRLAIQRAPAPKYELRLRGWDATLQPGVDIADRDKLFDLMDGR
jgi:hypothetical protein